MLPQTGDKVVLTAVIVVVAAAVALAIAMWKRNR